MILKIKISHTIIKFLIVYKKLHTVKRKFKQRWSKKYIHQYQQNEQPPLNTKTKSFADWNPGVGLGEAQKMRSQPHPS